MNEILGPFIYFSKENLPINAIYNYFSVFIDRFLNKLYEDKEYHILQCYLKLFSILLKYHEPEIYNFLKKLDINPELYAIPWFLTMFSNKLKIDLVYVFWELLILENDKFLIFYFGLALLKFKKKQIIEFEDVSSLLWLISNLTISGSDEFQQIYKMAIDLRYKTPCSFYIKLQKIDMYFTNNKYKDKI